MLIDSTLYIIETKLTLTELTKGWKWAMLTESRIILLWTNDGELQNQIQLNSIQKWKHKQSEGH